jgi:hypothetical protein
MTLRRYQNRELLAAPCGTCGMPGTIHYDRRLKWLAACIDRNCFATISHTKESAIAKWEKSGLCEAAKRMNDLLLVVRHFEAQRIFQLCFDRLRDRKFRQRHSNKHLGSGYGLEQAMNTIKYYADRESIRLKNER